MSKLVLIDRDGTINVEKRYLSSPDQIELLPGASEGIKLLRKIGFKVAVVTNQSAIGRAIIDFEGLKRIHARLNRVLKDENTKVDAIYFCAHLPENGCYCRKPADGMARRAEKEFDAQLSESFVVGDNICDVELGENIGAKTIMVRTGYGKKVEEEKSAAPDYIVGNLYDAAELIQKITKENHN